MYRLLFIGILTLGFCLRIIGLTYTPPSLNWDEVSHGYNAYSILKTGRDEWGKPFPLINFRAYGDYPTTLYMYLSIPFVYLFGLNDFSIRLPSVIFGSLTIILANLIATRVLVDIGFTQKLAKYGGLISCFLLSIAPWHILQSRGVFQSTIAIFFVSGAAAFYVNKNKNKYYLPLSIMMFTMSLFSYHNARIVVPIFLSFVAVKDKLLAKITQPSLALSLFIFSMSVIFIIRSPDSGARSKWISIIDKGAINTIHELRRTSNLPNYASKLLYNKITFWIFTFSKNYFNYFSPRFLFLSGGTQYQYSVPSHGLAYILELPFFYIGLMYFFYKKFNPMVMSIIIIAPVTAAITSGDFHVLRSSLMIPFVQIVTSTGLLVSIITLGKKYKSIATLIIFLFVISLLSLTGRYIYTLFTTYRTNYSWSWQFGYKQVASFIKNNPQYETVIITKKYGEPHEFLLFYLNYNPITYQNNLNKIAYTKSNWYWIDHFDKYWFINDWDIKTLTTNTGIKVPLSKQSLLITSPDNYSGEWQKIESIKFLDGSVAFDILKLK